MLIDNTLEVKLAAYLVAILERIGMWYLVISILC